MIQVSLFLCSALCLYLSLFSLDTRLTYSYLCLHRLFTSKLWYQYYSHTIHKRRYKWLHPWNSFSFCVLVFVLFFTLSRNCSIPGQHGLMKSSFFQEDTYNDYQISLQRNKEVRHDRLRVASLSGTTPPPPTTLPLLIRPPLVKPVNITTAPRHYDSPLTRPLSYDDFKLFPYTATPSLNTGILLHRATSTFWILKSLFFIGFHCFNL